MKKIASIRKHVNDNRTYYAFCAGSILTSTSILLITRKVDLLQVPKSQLELLKQGGAIVYNLRGQTLHLVNIDAVEAAAAAL